MDRIDFRSDTVTWPTPEMRDAMATAVVGDDVYGEDPTVNELESLAAGMMGKEAGLFVSSGSMGNLVSILTHATRGDEIIVGRDSHVMLWEAGNVSTLGGVAARALNTDNLGRMDPDCVEQAVRQADVHLPRSRLIHVENSYGDKHGYPLPPSYFAEIRKVANRHGLAVHMDGARLFNAAVAQGLSPQDIVRHVDSVNFCVSKGLCAPVGSVICGSTEFIASARRWRKAVGGGMRQAGILAAAGIVALNQMVGRLAQDHQNAAALAKLLLEIPGIQLEADMVRTNIVYFGLEEGVPVSVDEIITALRERANIWIGRHGARQFRVVTHYWIGEDDVGLLADQLRQIVGINV